MCSNCRGDYENPDATQPEEELCCSHELADGSPAGRLNLGACSVECAICGEQLISLNFLVAPELRVKH